MVRRAKDRLTRDDWLAAALRALDEGGIEAVRVLPLAATLGASRGSFYWHFRDRDDLMRSLLDYWEAELTDSVIRRILEMEGSARERFRALLEDVLEHRRGRYEPAIRALAQHDPRAARVARRADRKRIAFVAGLFREMGFGAAESDARARLTFAYLLGDHVILARESPARRRELMNRRFSLLTRS